MKVFSIVNLENVGFEPRLRLPMSACYHYTTFSALEDSAIFRDSIVELHFSLKIAVRVSFPRQYILYAMPIELHRISYKIAVTVYILNFFVVPFFKLFTSKIFYTIRALKWTTITERINNIITPQIR